MKTYASAIALLLVAVAVVVVQIRNSKHDTQGQAGSSSFHTPNLTNLPASTRHHASAATQSRRRPSLAESLPPGSRILESLSNTDQVHVVLADGLHIKAAGASVLENGISFHGPFQVTGTKGVAMNSDDEGAVFLLSSDGATFKMLPRPGGVISMGANLK